MTRRPALDRRALFGMGAAAALLAVSGVSAAGMARRGGRLRLAVSGGRRDDTWATGGGLFMQLARVGLVHDTLTEVAADGTLRGDLAQGWRSADNGQTWRFDLRQDVAFHDGHAMTAEDVADSLRRGLGETDIVEALGKSGVEITLSRPDAGLPFRLAGPGFAIGRQGAEAAGIGTGPYRLVEFSPGRRVVAERVTGHRTEGTSAWFDTVELVSIPSAAVRLQAFDEHLVDALDLAEGDACQPSREHAVLPTDEGCRQIVSRELALGARQGARLPFDDLRAPRRWWFA